MLNKINFSSLGSRIAYFRKQKGYSQEQLGALLGKTRQSVALYEGGKAEVTVNILFELANIFEIRITDFLVDPESEVHEPSQNYSGLGYIEELKFKLKQIHKDKEALERELADKTKMLEEKERIIQDKNKTIEDKDKIISLFEKREADVENVRKTLEEIQKKIIKKT